MVREERYFFVLVTKIIRFVDLCHVCIAKKEILMYCSVKSKRKNYDTVISVS